VDNFIVYVPIAYIISRHEQSWRTGTVITLFVCFAVFATQDVYIRSHIGMTGAYSRVSIVLGSITIFAALHAALPRTKKLPAIIAFFATYSLGIFAIHKYWKLFITLVARHYECSLPVFIFDINAFFKGIVCIILTCLTVYLIGRSRWKWLVR
jgi:multisubunit Na+/H+ antiporter MnhG subunit